MDKENVDRVGHDVDRSATHVDARARAGLHLIRSMVRIPKLVVPTPRNWKERRTSVAATCGSSVEHPFGGLATVKPKFGLPAHDFASQPCDWFAFIEDAEAQQATQICVALRTAPKRLEKFCSGGLRTRFTTAR
jgi:hypothetical protein